MTSQGTTPPGWYPDAQGTIRWYDGTRWTHHVQPDGPTRPPPAYPPGAQPGPPDPRRPRAGLIAVLVLVAVALVAGLAVTVVVLVGGDSGEESVAADPTSSTTEDASPTPEPSAEPSTIEPPTSPPTTIVPPPAPEGTPNQAVQGFLRAVQDGDCETAASYLTGKVAGTGECTDVDLLPAGESITFDVGRVAVDGERATVPVTLSIGGDGLDDAGVDLQLSLRVVDDTWKISDFGVPDPPSGQGG